MGGFAASWATALHGAGAVPADVETTERVLTRLVDRLAHALSADPFRPETGHEVGAELFGIHATGEPLGATVACLLRLPEAVGVDPGTAAERLPSLLGALVTGYTAALKACTLEDLETHTTGTSREARAQAAEGRGDAREAAECAAVALLGRKVPSAFVPPLAVLISLDRVERRS